MKQLILAILILGSSASSGIFAQFDNGYWIFGQRYDAYSVAIDSNSQCTKYDGVNSLDCDLKDWSIILASKDLIIK